MPLDAWLLLVVSVGFGLGIELLFMRARVREGRAGGGAGTSVEPGGVEGAEKAERRSSPPDDGGSR